MNEYLCESNYCEHGLYGILEHVLNGTRSLAVLAGTVRGVCTECATHSPHCIQHFHHKTYTIPLSVTRAFFKAHWQRLQDRIDLVAFVLRTRTSPLLGAIGVADRLPLKAYDALLRAVKDRGLRAAALAEVLHLLPRDSVLRASPICATIEDAQGACAIKAYIAWLEGGAPQRQFAWQAHILRTCDAALHSLPHELVELIKRFVFR